MAARIYTDPLQPRQRPNLIAGLISTPSTPATQPLENQMTETLAWLIDRSPAFARAFIQLFVMNDVQATAAAAGCSAFGASTQVRLPKLPGAGHPRPDLSVCGDGRRFQGLIEVK